MFGGEHLKSWDHKLCQAEFAHNDFYQSTMMSSLEVVYGFFSGFSLDLALLPISSKLHAKASGLLSTLHEPHYQSHLKLLGYASS